MIYVIERTSDHPDGGTIEDLRIVQVPYEMDPYKNDMLPILEKHVRDRCDTGYRVLVCCPSNCGSGLDGQYHLFWRYLDAGTFFVEKEGYSRYSLSDYRGKVKYFHPKEEYWAYPLPLLQGILREWKEWGEFREAGEWFEEELERRMEEGLVTIYRTRHERRMEL